jgi:trehalose 6-phosphate phosphatase
MPRPLPQLSANAAFFIDFDGTLVEIAARPELVEVEPRVRQLLEALRERYGGAVAIVTGRPLDVVDRFLAPLLLPTAAEHGHIRRDAKGMVHADTDGADAVALVLARLAPLVEANPGLVMERKASSGSLHYRQRPELGEICARAVEAAMAGLQGLSMMHGKMVFDIKPAGVSKGTAVAGFLGEAPFKGRLPVYAGDDRTDECAFATVNDLGGVSIKIGDGDTMAKYRTDRESLLAWLRALADRH